MIYRNARGHLVGKWPWANETDRSRRDDSESQGIIKKGCHQLTQFILLIQAPLSNVLMLCKNGIIKHISTFCFAEGV